jgi:hypothetical protein
VPNEEFVAGLSGVEIINDVLGQIRKALERDCNLRESDNYGRGYSGSIKISLQLFDIDVAKIETEMTLAPTQELLKSAPETPQDADGQDVKVDLTVEIPATTDLTAVRERSNQDEPPAPEVPVDPNVPAVPQRRSYGKPPTLGGAVDVTD